MKILIPTNLSKASQDAADFALSYFGYRASYCLLNSYPLMYRSGFYDSLTQYTPEHDDVPMEQLKRERKRLVQKFGDRDIHLKAFYGDPVADIFKTAEEENAYLVVLGYASFKKWNDAFKYRKDHALQDLPYPILLVPENHTQKTTKTVYYITDFSNSAISDSMSILRDIARFSRATIKLFCFEGINEERGLEKWMIDKYLGEIEHTFEFIRDKKDGLDKLNKELQTKEHALVIIDNQSHTNTLMSSLEKFVNQQAVLKPMLLMPNSFEDKSLRGA